MGLRQVPSSEGRGLEMKTVRIVACLGAIMALALITAATLAAANPHPTYTCVKVKENGQSDVSVNVPESAVAGLTNAGFTCVANATEGEGEDPGNEDPGDDPGSDPAITSSGATEVHVPQGQRSLYCSTNGRAFRANGEGMGIALNLLDEQGQLMVEMGLVTPASFYQGIGATCDVLPGFKSSGVWVDHVGDVVPGVAVYPLFIPTSG
jgi:hypothetical protein